MCHICRAAIQILAQERREAEKATLKICVLCEVEAENKGGELWMCPKCKDYDGIAEIKESEWYE